MSLRFSIVVPVYNVSQYIEQCIRSLFDQTFSSFEILAINDGSTDNSLELLYRLQRLDKRLKVFDKKNGGLSSARNFGVERAEGDYIIFLDSDDYLSPEALFVLNEKIKGHDLDVIKFGASPFMDGDGLPEKNYSRPALLLNRVMTGRLYFTCAVKEKAFLPSACLYAVKKSISQELTFLPHVYYEDNLYTVQLLFHEQCQRVMAIDDKLYQRRIRDGSITTTVSDKHYSDKLIIFDALKAFIENRVDLDKEEKSAYRVFLVDFLRSALNSQNLMGSSISMRHKKQLLSRLVYCVGFSLRSTVLLLRILFPRVYTIYKKIKG